MQTEQNVAIETRIVDLLKQRPNLTGTVISSLLDEDDIVIRNKLTMLVKDMVLFSQAGILEPTYHVSPLRTGWVIPTFREMGQAAPAAPTTHPAPVAPVVATKSAEVAEQIMAAPQVHTPESVDMESDSNPAEEASAAPIVVTSYTNKVVLAIAFLKSKDPGYVASSKELCIAMGLKQYGSAMNVLKYVVKKGIVCFHRYRGYWLPTTADAIIEPAPRTVKLKQRDPVSLPASIPQPRRVFGEAQPDEPESNYQEWLAQRGQDSPTAAVKPKAKEVASAPTAAAIETEAPKHDPIHNPSHYTNGGIEFIEVLRAKLSADEFRGFLKGNVIKYTLRAEHKNGAQDYAKGAKYAQWLAEAKPTPRPSLKPLLISPNVDLRALRKSVAEGYKASSATMLDLIDFAIQYHQPT
jgi:hypothetical protein